MPFPADPQVSSIAPVSWQGLDFDFTNIVFGDVDFSGAVFSGGTVDFSDPDDWSVPPAFPSTNTPPSGVKLPRKED
jgi:hypothetical protein